MNMTLMGLSLRVSVVKAVLRRFKEVKICKQPLN